MAVETPGGWTLGVGTEGTDVPRIGNAKWEGRTPGYGENGACGKLLARGGCNQGARGVEATGGIEGYGE